MRSAVVIGSIVEMVWRVYTQSRARTLTHTKQIKNHFVVVATAAHTHTTYAWSGGFRLGVHLCVKVAISRAHIKLKYIYFS